MLINPFTFKDFVEDYFTFLESAKITLDFTTNYVILEPETKGYLLSENGILGAAVDRIVLEDSTEYQAGELKVKHLVQRQK